MSWCKKKFWVEDPREFVCNIQQIIPTTSMSFVEQMNAFTRFTIFIFFIVLLVRPKSSIVFFILSLLFIIIIYYIQKKVMETYIENFSQPLKPLQPLKSTSTGNKIKPMLWSNDEVTLAPNNPNFLSLNQNLAGPPNPKTLIQPVVTPPPTALDYWRDNNLINHSHINRESQNDLYLSGYKVSNCCDITDCDTFMIPEENLEHYKPFRNRPSEMCNPIISPTPVTTIPFSHNKQNIIKEGFQCEPIISPQPVSVTPFNKNILREDFTNLHTKNGIEILPNESGWVNTTCGYNSEQLYDANLPTNLKAGKCEKQEEMKQFNKNLFTQNIQPDIYTQNEIIEPVNSNIGISFTQQFPPSTYTQKDGKGLTYTEHDPRIFHPKLKPQQIQSNVTEADVYDPRFYGYGTSYRTYNDNDIGQTRFYYDDINSVRMPNYITRSNIDFASYADTYGPLQKGSEFGNKFNSNIRSLAQDTFLSSSLQQRTELQQRLMRKRNNELWRVRKYPIRTFGSQMKTC